MDLSVDYLCTYIQHAKDLNDTNLNYRKVVRKHLGSDCLCSLMKIEPERIELECRTENQYLVLFPFLLILVLVLCQSKWKITPV